MVVPFLCTPEPRTLQEPAETSGGATEDDDSIAELHRSERPDQPEGAGI